MVRIRHTVLSRKRHSSSFGIVRVPSLSLFSFLHCIGYDFGLLIIRIPNSNSNKAQSSRNSRFGIVRVCLLYLAWALLCRGRRCASQPTAHNEQWPPAHRGKRECPLKLLKTKLKMW